MIRNVHIIELESGFNAVVDPGIRIVDPGDKIKIHNDTTFQVKLLFAEGGLLIGVGSMQGKTINSGEIREFTVGSVYPDIYEYVVSVKLSGGKRVFAVGASTPKIIVRPPAGSASTFGR